MTNITSSGTYGAGDHVLANDIVVAGGTALTFTDTGTLNMNGFTVRSTAGGIGILITGGLKFYVNGNNGGYVDGFEYGVYSTTPITYVQGVIFQNIKYLACNLSGHDSRFLDNIVTNVGGVSNQAYSVGVNIAGNNSIVAFNEFRDFYRQATAPPSLIGEGCPIILNASCSGVLVRMNYMKNTTIQDHTIGIFGGSGGNHIVRDNTIVNFKNAIQGGGASPGIQILENLIQLLSSKIGSIGVSADFGSVTQNVFIGYETPISGSVPNSNNFVG